MSACDDGREIARGDAEYPTSLLDLHDAPSRLYVRGDPTVLRAPCLSVVGARRSTPYGRAIAEMAGRIAAEAGIVVVSGGARGCDQAAGRAALDAGGKHVMVLGTGADVLYPASSKDIEQRLLCGGGCIVSVEPWGTPVQRWAFPKRNRIIAALSAALLVAEAGMPSGTFSTAEAANELGREVFSVPGSMFAPECKGSNYLIANGATCIADEESLEVAISRVYGTLRFMRGNTRGLEGLAQEDRAIVDALVADSMRPDDLAISLGRDALWCLKRLSALEVAGVVEPLLDGRYALTCGALHSLTRLGHNG